MKRLLSLALSFMMCLSIITFPSTAMAEDEADHLVISQVYGGGGNSGAPYNKDFIELYNPTDAPISLSGYSLLYYAANGNAGGSAFALSGTIAPKGYFLVSQGGGSNGADLPTPDAVGSFNMAAANGTAALLKDGVEFDVVGFGTATKREGSATPALSNTTAAIRKGVGDGRGIDTNNNASDFEVKAPDPRNSAYGSAPVQCATPIASPASGTVSVGATVTLSTSTSEASIYYTTDGTDPVAGASTLYTAPFALPGSAGDTVTVKAIAVKSGLTDSSVASFTYQIYDSSKVLTIKEALALPAGSSSNKTPATVQGQIVYFATSYSNPVLQELNPDGKVYSLYVYGAAPEGAKVGDIVQLTGTYWVRYGAPQLDGLTDSKIVGSDTPMAAQEVTIKQLLDSADSNYGLKILGRFVKIKDVTLGAASGSYRSVKDPSTTASINIYNPTPLPTGVEEGDVVDLYAMVGCYNSTVQLYTGTAEANGFNVYDVVNDTKAPTVTLPEQFLNATPGMDYLVSAEASDNKGLQSVELTYTIGSTTKTVSMAKNTENGKYEFTIPGAEIVSTANSISLTVTAKDVTGLTTSKSATVTISNKPVVTAVTPARNSATKGDKTPVISVTLENAGDAPTVTLTLKTEQGTNVVQDATMTLTSGSTYAYTPTSPLADGKYTAIVTVTKQGGISITETWSFYVGEPKYTAYFGQLHSHTAEYSDGAGTLANGLDYIKNIPTQDNVDFVAFTDHSNYFDSTSAANPAEALNDIDKMTAASRAKWEKYTGDIRAFNTENAGAVVALPGFEMTWSGGPGHINTFNSKGLVSRNNSSLNNKTADAGMKLYYETLIQNPDELANLSQFNHPGKTFGTFSDFAYYTPAYDAKMVAVEVGNGEGAIGSGGYFPSYTEYTKALDKGWHVAPTNNQDNHKGKWGNANTARTVIITDDFSELGLLKGLKNMSVYTTEDKNLNVSYTLNDQIMGSIIDTVPTDPLKFAVHVDDPDASDVISKVEIVTNNGRIAASKSFSSNAADWEFELPADAGYYYVRVTQADTNIAVTAPVWVGASALIGINSFEADTKLPVTGEPLTLTAKLFNNEAAPATLKSITYKVGDVVLKEEQPGTAIPSMSLVEHSLTHTFTAAGRVTVTVFAVITINGKDLEFSQRLELNVRESDKLVYVGIDASHYNEYVRGNYKDSMGNFANMAVEYGVRVVELETKEALIAATQNPKYKMLVLTPPTRRDGSAFKLGYKSYDAEEIAAVKAFAEQGNTVILTGWGDYYESYTKYTDNTPHTLPAEQHMAAQQNNILRAIGASLRLSDDEIKDDTNNGGQAMRLYLTNYNMGNPFLARVDADKQVYSNYGGCTVYAVDASGQPVSALPAHVSGMVFGHGTSYSSDDDKDNFAGVTIPKYDDRYMVAASETVTHGNGKTSTVIVAGSAFMSNFEIQAELDNWETPQYSNYTILENIIRSINPVEISSIADVHAAPEGQEFTIRGTVTSNASGYDKDTAFFDCIYVQDATRGINLFPVAGNFKIGDVVLVTGMTSSYNGERQLDLSKGSIEKVGDGTPVVPATVTAAAAMSPTNTGNLMKVSGTVTDLIYAGGILETIFVTDETGTARVFIDGYIMSSYQGLNDLKKGDQIEAIGLGSITADTSGGTFIPRLRVRNRAEIKIIGTSPEPTPTPEPTPPPQSTPGSDRSTLSPSTGTPQGGSGVEVKGNFSAGSRLYATDLSRSSRAGTALTVAAFNHTVLGMQQLSLSGRNFGPMRVSFQVGAAYEGQTLTVLHYNEQTGRVTEYTGKVVNGTLTVQVNTLGAFAVIAEIVPLSVMPPKTGDAGVGVGTLLLLLGALGTVYAIQGRQKRLQKP